MHGSDVGLAGGKAVMGAPWSEPPPPVFLPLQISPRRMHGGGAHGGVWAG